MEKPPLLALFCPRLRDGMGTSSQGWGLPNPKWSGLDSHVCVNAGGCSSLPPFYFQQFITTTKISSLQLISE